MLTLHTPTLGELSFRQEWLADEATMAYNHAYGGCIDFPPGKWENWYKKWLKDDTNSRFYRYLYNEELKAFVGEIAYHWDEELKCFLCDVLIHGKYRGKGFGREGLNLLCAAAKERGLIQLFDNIAVDNSSLNLFLSCGFEEISRNEEAVLVRKIL